MPDINQNDTTKLISLTNLGTYHDLMDAKKEEKSVILTQAEYDALTPAEKMNGKTYYITDAGSSGMIITASDVDMTGYSKPAATSPITTSDTASSAIGKLEKALDSIPAAQVNSDWAASSGVAEILHKPTLGTAAAKDSTNSVTANSTDLVESGAVKTAIDNAISSVYKACGDKTVAQLTSSLLIASNLGNVYNITDSGTTTSDFIGGAGKAILTGDNVAIVDVGSSTYKFDLLSGFVDLSNYIQTSNTSGLVKNDGTIDTTTYISDISGKADKVSNATSGNFAGLDNNGNLTDSGSKASDFATASHNQASNTINIMTGYEKASAVSAISTSDTLNQAIGKLEKGLESADIPVATTSVAGKVKPDGVTTTVDANGVLTAVGGGTTVTVTPSLSGGVKIADYSIDEVPGVLYAPQGIVLQINPTSAEIAQFPNGTLWLEQ